MTLYYRNVTITAELDGTAPILTNPSATATSTTTADGAVSTNENTGTLYTLASPVLSPLASAVIAANLAQAVTQTGNQPVVFTGLTPGVLVYPHFVHVDEVGNISLVSTGAAFTPPATQTLYFKNITITAAQEGIQGVSGSRAGTTITLTTTGVYDLTVSAPSALTYGGIALTSVTVTGANTLTAVMPLAGLEPNTNNNFVLTVNGLVSPGYSAPFLPALGRAVEFTVAYAAFPGTSPWLDDELIAAATLVAGDWAEAPLKSNPTVRMPAGYDVNLDGLGNCWLSDPVGTPTGQGLDLETEVVTVPCALIDASDNYSRSVTQLVFSPDVPEQTVVINSIAPAANGATIAFSYPGADITGFQYRIGGSGSWTAIAASPLLLSGQAANTAYSGEIRPVFGSVYGVVTQFNYTTAASDDTTPNALLFNQQYGVARSIQVTSNADTVTGVSAGLDVPISAVNGEYSISTNNGVAWGAWTSAPGIVRLNYQVRVRVLSSALYEDGATAELSTGGVISYFSVETLLDVVAPVLSLVGGNMTISAGSTWIEPGFSATDNADGTIPVGRLASTGTVNTAVLGTYVITYTATDLAGNVGTTTRTVTVIAAIPFDGIAPVLSIVGGNITLDIGDTWVDPGATATDNIDGNITNSIVVSGSVNTGVAGVYPVTYTVTDAAGNTATATRQVSVVQVIVYPLTDPAPASRTLVVGGALRLEAGGGYFEKQPVEVLDFDIDLTALLAAEADTIIPGSIQVDGASFVIAGVGLVVGQPSRIKLWVAGGVDGTNAKIEVTLTTAGYRKRQFELRVIVVDR